MIVIDETKMSFGEFIRYQAAFQKKCPTAEFLLFKTMCRDFQRQWTFLKCYAENTSLDSVIGKVEELDLQLKKIKEIALENDFDYTFFMRKAVKDFKAFREFLEVKIQM